MFFGYLHGWPGSVHDARVLAHSTFYKKANAGQLLSHTTKTICGASIPVFVIGDSAYPMLPWLMKPYNQPSVDSSEKRTYNHRISRGRIVVEIAFGRLKARWRRPLKRNDILIKNVPTVVSAAFVLHNICEIHGECFDKSWASNASSDLTQPDRRPTDSTAVSGSASIREALVDYFNN